MTESDNAALIRRWFEEGWNQRNPDLIDELFSSTYRAEGGPHGTLDRLAYKQYFDAITTAAPDMVCNIIELLDAGEYVISRILSEGTHLGSTQGIEATGEFISTEVIDVWKIIDGKIVERKNAEFDNMGIKEQVKQPIRFESD